MEHLDVVIVGAGLSGIGMAWHLQDRCPTKTYAILEARETSGGTWDLFRYPGVRSDSDMQTLGYRFKPWTGSKALADGPSILTYVRETASEAGIERHIRYGHKVVRAEWSTQDSLWTVHAEGREPLRSRFLLNCSGYYRYDKGFTPPFEGREDFAGEIVHPQFWPEDLDATGKRVVVIGSGATAVTLVPALARSGARHVTMLQRSPSYILAMPDEDAIANVLRKRIGERRAYAVVRWKNVVLQTLLFQLSQRFPHPMRKLYRAGALRQLPAGFAIDTHLNPRYKPWDQRLCLVPNGDLFETISDGSAEIVTAEIERFTERGIRLRDGSELEADVIVTATGLNLLMFGGMELALDGERGRPPAHDGLQVDDAQRPAQLRLHGRLHERVVDAEGRPRGGVRLPADQPHGRQRPPPGGARARPVDRRAAVHGLLARLRPALDRRAAPAGVRGAVAAEHELHHRHRQDPPRAGRRRRAAVHLITRDRAGS